MCGGGGVEKGSERECVLLLFGGDGSRSRKRLTVCIGFQFFFNYQVGIKMNGNVGYVVITAQCLLFANRRVGIDVPLPVALQWHALLASGNSK